MSKETTPTPEQWFEEINRLKRKLVAAKAELAAAKFSAPDSEFTRIESAALKAIAEFVRRNHNTGSVTLMELIAEYDAIKGLQGDVQVLGRP